MNLKVNILAKMIKAKYNLHIVNAGYLKSISIVTASMFNTQG